MFRCNDCGKEFEEPKVVPEYRGEFWGAPAYEDEYYCPNCGSDDYEEISAESPKQRAQSCQMLLEVKSSQQDIEAKQIGK